MVLDHTSTKAAWALIAEYFSVNMEKLDVRDSFAIQSASVLDAVQTLYKGGLISEFQRDQMRGHVTEWLGSPETRPEFSSYRDVYDYARYACGRWAPSAGPMGRDEHSIIVMTLQILEEEAA